MKHPTPEQLSAFHDGTASAGTIVAVEQHLNECSECHEFLASLERQDRALMATLTHDPGDAHFEALAARIEARLGAAPAADAADAAPAAPAGFLGRYWDGLRRFRAPEWAGAVAAVIVGLGLVLLNVKHGTAPTMRDHALEQRAGQTADALEKKAQGGAPGAASDLGKEQARDEARNAAPPSERMVQEPAPAVPPASISAPAAGAVPPPAAAAAPATGTAFKPGAAQSRAKIVKSTPTGENQRAPAPGFARAPSTAGATSPAQKPRRAEPLEESQPKTEGEAAPPADKKDADRTRRENEAKLQHSGGATAPSPTATLPPTPEAPSNAASKAGARPQAFAEPQTARRDAGGAPQAMQRDAGGAPSTIPFCGVIKNSRGQPIPHASVNLVSQGTGVSSDAAGKFCIDAPPGDQTLSVMAVGYAPLRLDVHVVPNAAPPTLTLIAITVITETSQLRGAVLGGHAQTGAPGQVLSSFPDSQLAIASRAIKLTLEAERTKSAQRYDAAAVEWEKVPARTTDASVALEARFRAAETRYRSWLLAPTPKRVADANEALTSYLVRAPMGARRDTASAWLGRVKP
jgi:carboxypeptidase family protein/putative zinc finger protein